LNYNKLILKDKIRFDHKELLYLFREAQGDLILIMVIIAHWSKNWKWRQVELVRKAIVA
jgi:hypothetical protein